MMFTPENICTNNPDRCTCCCGCKKHQHLEPAKTLTNHIAGKKPKRG